MGRLTKENFCIIEPVSLKANKITNSSYVGTVPCAFPAQTEYGQLTVVNSNEM